MSRHRKIILAVIGIALVMATIHVTINGLPALGTLNPHSR